MINSGFFLQKMPLKSYQKKIFFSFLFAVAMAYLESAVVVYLRALYYPQGFRFPLSEIPLTILIVEIGREVATIIMLWAVARLSGRNRHEIFAYFCLNFGIWDIWYYIWLKIFLNWPVSVLDWDILFLIPLPWVGPVLAPLLISLALILAAVVILHYEETGSPVRLNRSDWLLEIVAGLIIILSFLLQPDPFMTEAIPTYYPWWIFTIGMVSGLGVFFRRVLKTKRAGSGIYSRAG
jgi:hypothetical protein